MAIDSHMHINSVILKDLKREIKLVENDPNLEKVINVGLNYKTSEESVLISHANQKFYSAIGVHPLYLDSPNFDFLYYLSQSNKVVAIGEIGLDASKDNIEFQKECLIKQIIIANDLKLPIIIHSNNTNKQVIEIFEKTVKPKYGCVFHCFQPDIENLKYLMSNGYYISFAGRITYKTANKSLEVIKTVPTDLFLVETDSPYITPEPFRKEINHSSNIKYIIKKIADIKGKSYKEIEHLSTENTKRLFKKIK